MTDKTLSYIILLTSFAIFAAYIAFVAWYPLDKWPMRRRRRTGGAA